MQLSELVPIANVEAAAHCRLQVERIDSNDWHALAARDPGSTFAIGLHAWHRIVTRGGTECDPRSIGTFVDSQEPLLIEKIEALLRTPVVKEVGFISATCSKSSDEFVVATSCAAWLQSGELYLHDIALLNPNEPLPKRKRKSVDQTHRGFGLLSNVFGNAIAAAKERDAVSITLLAAFDTLIPVFERYGFRVEQNSHAQRALAFGVGIPMELRV